MRKSQILIVGLALVAGYAAGLALNRPTVGQGPALEALPSPTSGAPARYHTTVVSKGGSYPLLILTDTSTGHCWLLECGPQQDEEWRDLGAPSSAKR